jgi:tetratricopeptide (TPR) repeat protein
MTCDSSIKIFTLICGLSGRIFPMNRNPAYKIMRSNKIILPAIFLFSLALHSTIYYTVFSKNDQFPKYPGFALQCAHSAINPERLADFSPLYLMVHVIAQKYVSHPKEAVLWLQFVLVAGSAVLLFLLLRSFFTTWIALAGAMIFVTNRSILVYSSVFEPEVLIIFFLLGFLVLVVRKSRLMAFVAGVSFALILLLRLNLLPVALIVPLYFYLNGERNRILLQRTILFIVPVFLAITLLAIRNHSFTGTFSPVTMNPGYPFYCGNNPTANGQIGVYPPMVQFVAKEIPKEVDRGHVAYLLFPRRISGKQLSIPEANSYWTHKALNFIVDHPLYWFKAIIRKCYSTFHAVRWHDIDRVNAIDHRLQKTMIPTVPFGLISAMAIIGMLLSLRAWRERLVFYAVILCQIGVMAMTFASDRQRISVLVLFVFFAAASLTALLDRNITGRRKVMLMVAALGLFPFLSMKNDLIKDGLYQRSQIERAQMLLSKAQKNRSEGKLPQASEENAMVMALVPYFTESRLSGLMFAGQTYSERALSLAESLHAGKAGKTGETGFSSQLDIALLCIENGRLTQAETILKELIRGRRAFSRTSAQSSQPCFYLAKVYELQGREPEALLSLQKALTNNPGDPWVLSHLAVLTGDHHYKDAIIRYFDEIDAAYFLGLASLDNDRIDEAVKNFNYLVEKVPEYRAGFIYLSIALGAKGDFDRAARSYIQAMAKEGEPLFGEKEILTIFYQWAKQNPPNTESRYYLGMVLKDFGHYEEALDIFRQLVHKNPSIDMVVKTNIEWLENAEKAML